MVAMHFFAWNLSQLWPFYGCRFWQKESYPMKKFALIALPLALAACSQTEEETTVEPMATETAMAEPMPAETTATDPMATDTAAPTATDTAAPAAGATATPAATETPAQ
jgi:hypothetical protein